MLKSAIRNVNKVNVYSKTKLIRKSSKTEIEKLTYSKLISKYRCKPSHTCTRTNTDTDKGAMSTKDLYLRIFWDFANKSLETYYPHKIK